ncbi:nitronate monooxygenase [Brevundimonas sp.]|uniref:NAD(P)H-dependent flavin oxidoreductase n=1 Tax=Brevundimonas sp. TaxID=1871086 RepID=UPI0019A8120F|nr:nitronate monooxygenase [Brevundimonas sp.]MBD3837340.1 nitronate monooxygenase [Brevundimonas sp.]
MTLLTRLGLSVPIIQAPMAGVSTPGMAAVVANAGALGSIAVGATDADGARAMMAATRALTERPFNVNLFAHAPARADPMREAAWLEALRPTFESFCAETPVALREIYSSFLEDDAMLAALLETPPAVVSFHFGLPGADRIRALKGAGCMLLATVTHQKEAEAARAAGIDAVVAQGWEAGGHRGVFDPAAPDERLGTLALTRLLVVRGGLPVIAAGGIMDGRGVRAALDLGAVAAQLGTAFVACPESAADAAYKAALIQGDGRTAMTDAVSGRPARCLRNRFVDLGEAIAAARPDYPIAYDAGKALNAAAKAKGEPGFGAQWAGQGAALARSLPAGELVAALAQEMADA